MRGCKQDLAALVSLEAGKIRSEAEGEVQEMIDVCDFAVGLSRMLHGLTMHSEAYGQVTIGNPLEEGVLMGPLIDLQAVDKPTPSTGLVNCPSPRAFGSESSR
jgi:acyl-CoA reductase-like NAD-dependent aldehyde dehydrogenase